MSGVRRPPYHKKEKAIPKQGDEPGAQQPEYTSYSQQVILNLQTPTDPKLREYDRYPGGAAELKKAIEQGIIRLPSPGGTSRGIWIDGVLGDSKKDKPIIKDQVLIDLPAASTPFKLPKTIEGMCRLYIIGHGEAGLNRLVGTAGEWTTDDFAKLICSNIAAETSLRISIIACQGGVDGLHKKPSFAHQLYDALTKELSSNGIVLEELEIVARTGDVARRTAFLDHHNVDGRERAEGDMILISNGKTSYVTYKEGDIHGVFRSYDSESSTEVKNPPQELKVAAPPAVDLPAPPAAPKRLDANAEPPTSPAASELKDQPPIISAEMAIKQRAVLDAKLNLLNLYRGNQKIAVEKVIAKFLEASTELAGKEFDKHQLNTLFEQLRLSFLSAMKPYNTNEHRNRCISALIIATFTLLGALAGLLLTPPVGLSIGLVWGYKIGGVLAGCQLGFFIDKKIQGEANPPNAYQLTHGLIRSNESLFAESLRVKKRQ